MGTLYLVGTPIGNLGDLSPRAAEILKTVDFIAAEDTRVTLKLLNHFGIKNTLISYHEHNAASRGPELLQRLTGNYRSRNRNRSRNTEPMAISAYWDTPQPIPAAIAQKM